MDIKIWQIKNESGLNKTITIREEHSYVLGFWGTEFDEIFLTEEEFIIPEEQEDGSPKLSIDIEENGESVSYNMSYEVKTDPNGVLCNFYKLYTEDDQFIQEIGILENPIDHVKLTFQEPNQGGIILVGTIDVGGDD